MSQSSTTTIDIPVEDENGQQPMRTQLPRFFAVICLVLLQCFNYILTLAGAIQGGLVAPVCHVWVHYYPIVALVQEGVVMPHSALGFTIGVLIGFAQIKAQGEPEFPFKTHPHHIRLCTASVIMYSLACAMELVASAFGLQRTCVFVIIVRLGKIGFLCLLVATMACFFLF